MLKLTFEVFELRTISQFISSAVTAFSTVRKT